MHRSCDALLLRFVRIRTHCARFYETENKAIFQEEEEVGDVPNAEQYVIQVIVSTTYLFKEEHLNLLDKYVCQEH